MCLLCTGQSVTIYLYYLIQFSLESNNIVSIMNPYFTEEKDWESLSEEAEIITQKSTLDRPIFQSWNKSH